MARNASKKNPQKTSGLKGLLIKLGVFAFAIYASVSLIDMQINMANRRRQLSELEQSVESQRIANKELERQLYQGMDQKYIERIARERLGFIAPDETVYIDISGN